MSILILFGGTTGASQATPTDPGDITNTNATAVPSNYEICDRTGFRLRRNTLKEEWTGAKIRSKSWEPRNAQDFVRGRADNQRGSPRPEQADVYITTAYPNGVDPDTDL